MDALVHAALLSHRDELPLLLAERGLSGTGVEIGVQRALYSEVILERSTLSRLILVDPWREFSDYLDVSNVEQERQDAFFAQAQQRLARFGDRAEFWRLTSLEASAKLDDASLDFIYIDARHDHDSVREDLHAWYPKLAADGIIAGHDYFDATIEQGVFGVRSAVDEFCAQHGLAAYDTYADRPWPSWIIVARRQRHLEVLRELRWFELRARRTLRRLAGR
jgi:hypothetical protein